MFKRRWVARRPVQQAAGHCCWLIGLLACCLLLVRGPVASAQDGDTNMAEIPVSGTAVAKFAELDRVLLGFRETIAAQALTVAVSQNGELLFARGYGWRDAARQEPVTPDSLLRIASVTKPITAAAVRKLVRDEKLALSTPVLEFLEIPVPEGVTPDPRWQQITVAHLLDHRGGWDREQAYDPMFRLPDVEKFLNLKSPARPIDVIRYMLSQPLQFDPGERSAYSNFGYCILGRVIEQASGSSYRDHMLEQICRPIGMTSIALGQAQPQFDAGEVWYPAAKLTMEVMDAHGGWIASTPELCRFLDHYWLSGEPRQAGEQRDGTFFGSLPGTTAMVRQRRDGYNIAVLANNRRDKQFRDDHATLKREIDALFDALSQPPQP